MENVNDIVVQVLADQAAISVANIQDEQTMQDLGLDSLDIVETQMKLEEQIGIDCTPLESIMLNTMTVAELKERVIELAKHTVVE